jgi:hypothetical protein
MLTPAPGTWVTVGAEVDYTNFVSATVGKGSGSTRLEPYVLTGSDGTVQQCPRALTTAYDRLYDTQRSEDCRLGFAADGLTRCLPRAQPTASTFSDNKCTMPAFALIMGCNGAPMYGQTSDTPAACGVAPSNHLFSLGTMLASAFVGIPNPGGPLTCQGSTQTATFYSPGAEIPASSFVEMTEMSSGSGRLRPRMYLTSDGLQQFRGFFDDSQLNLQCNLAVAGDGQVRCLPGNRTAVLNAFSDSKCKMPLNVVSVVGSATCPATAPAYAHQRDTMCPSGDHVFSVGAKTTVTAAFSNTSGTCTALTLDPNAAFFAVGAEIAATMFAPATPQTN